MREVGLGAIGQSGQQDQVARTRCRCASFGPPKARRTIPQCMDARRISSRPISPPVLVSSISADRAGALAADLRERRSYFVVDLRRVLRMSDCWRTQSHETRLRQSKFPASWEDAEFSDLGRFTPIPLPASHCSYEASRREFLQRQAGNFRIALVGLQAFSETTSKEFIGYPRPDRSHGRLAPDAF